MGAQAHRRLAAEAAAATTNCSYTVASVAPPGANRHAALDPTAYAVGYSLSPRPRLENARTDGSGEILNNGE